jgi:hypothetical protein
VLKLSGTPLREMAASTTPSPSNVAEGRRGSARGPVASGCGEPKAPEGCASSTDES